MNSKPATFWKFTGRSGRGARPHPHSPAPASQPLFQGPQAFPAILLWGCTMPRRIDRVNEQLRSEISHLLAREIKDPRVAGVISVTEVIASSDLRSARVYVSVMGRDADRQSALEGIRSAASFLRRELRDRVNLRHTPHLTFYLDDSIEEGDRVLRLMEGLTPEQFPAEYLEQTEPVQRIRESRRYGSQ